MLKRYDVYTVYGDRYASQWVVERFRAEGIRYETPEAKIPGEPEATRYLDKSLAYSEVEPLFAQGQIALLDHPQLRRELTLLERRPRSGGKTLIDHPSGGHDDHANALVLAAALAARLPTRPWAGPVVPSGISILGEPRTHVGGFVAGSRPLGIVGGQAAYIQRLDHN